MAKTKTQKEEAATIEENAAELVWRTEFRKLKDLKEHGKNPRKITKDQMEKLKQSLKNLINNSSKKDQLVFDFFLGSGTTLIAAEQLGRRCFGCELDPKYCDVIVDRYRKYKLQKNEPCAIKLNGEDYA